MFEVWVSPQLLRELGTAGAIHRTITVMSLQALFIRDQLATVDAFPLRLLFGFFVELAGLFQVNFLIQGSMVSSNSRVGNCTHP